MSNKDTCYWCHTCKKGLDNDDVKVDVYADAVLHGDNSHPTEYDDPKCPDCGEYVSEAEQCDGCQEIVEKCHQYRNVRVCADCLPIHMLSDAISNTKFNIACQLVTLLGMTYDAASARVTEVFNDYDFNEGE